MLGGRRAVHLREVLLLHPVARMHQPVRELAVVREQEEPFAVAIEPADGEHPWAVVGQEPADVRAPLRVVASWSRRPAGLCSA